MLQGHLRLVSTRFMHTSVGSFKNGRPKGFFVGVGGRNLVEARHKRTMERLLERYETFQKFCRNFHTREA